MFRFVRAFAPVVGLLAAFGCSDSTDPGSPTRITDVDVARNAWVSNHPGSYVFDVAISSSMGTDDAVLSGDGHWWGRGDGNRRQRRPGGRIRHDDRFDLGSRSSEPRESSAQRSGVRRSRRSD